MAQTVKNLPAMQKTWVQSLGWEDLLEESLATYCSILAWRIPMDRGVWQAIVPGVTQSGKEIADLEVPCNFQMSSPLDPSWGFPGSSAGKESTCNAGDPGSIPGSGRFPEEGIGYPL